MLIYFYMNEFKMKVIMLQDMILAVIVDFLLGDPYNFPHPVKFMGKIIYYEEKIVRRYFKSNIGLKVGGFLIVIINMGIGFFVPYFLLKVLRGYNMVYHIVNIYLIYICISAKCLHIEAKKVYDALSRGIDEARDRLSYIVGRDTKNLDEGEIIRADVETVAENTSDGIIAPLFYIMIFGASGGMMYKMVNTMDSMLGYKNEKYKDIGYFPAKNDDLFNLIPSRLSGILMCISSVFRFDVKNGFKIMFRDRKNHKSPNSAYPEGAAAGLLNIQLGGNNYYSGELVEKPTIGDKTKVLEKKDIIRTIEIMYRAEILFLLIYIVIKIV
ncbi:cobalamin biosynthesis protein [Sporanaerobacter sp. PP17-6a]|nr:cobalamin biosynthesis protein [Sporanaerobacter sp. PP17-6a]